MKKVALIMGSASDLMKVEKAITTFAEYGVSCEVHVLSAHRTPDEVRSFASSAAREGFGAIICAAGKAAHLAGAVAACTTIPVVGIPVSSSTLDGIDALLSTVQMPAGIPVACVAIDGSVNAALLCIEMLALGDEALSAKLIAARAQAAQKVLETDREISGKYSV